MIICVYHNEDIHFEMIGYIIEYCIYSKFEVHIYSYFKHIPNGNSVIRWYQNFFRDPLVKWFYEAFPLENIKYDVLFLISDSHPEYHLIQEKYHEKVITIEHWVKNRCKMYTHGIGTRYFIDKPINYRWAFPCYNMITESEKRMALSSVERTQVLFIGRFNNLTSSTLCFFNDMENIDFHIINWTIEPHHYKYLVKLPNIYFHSEMSMKDLITLAEKSHYIFFNPSYIEGYCTHKTSASLHLAYSTLCIPIIPNYWNNNYKLDSVVEYDDLEYIKPNKQLQINIDIYYELLPKVIDQKIKFISQRNREFDFGIEKITGKILYRQLENFEIFIILKQFNIKIPNIYIETGIGRGNTFDKMIPFFRELYGIDINKKYIDDLTKIYNHRKNIYLYNDYSDNILTKFINIIDDDALIFLDAKKDTHFYGRKDDNGNALLSELQIISKRKQKDIIFFINTDNYTSELIGKYLNKKYKLFERDNIFILIPDHTEIEKNIYQVCIKPFNKDKIPPYVLDNIKHKSQEFDYFLYDDEKVNNFLSLFSKEIQMKYYSCTSAPHRKDLFSALLLYHRGGIYFDLDSEPIIPFIDIIRNYTFVSFICVREGDGLAIGFIACTKNNPIIEKICNEYVSSNLEIEIFNDYTYLTKIAGNVVMNFIGIDKLVPGEYIVNDQKILLLQETWKGEGDYKGCRAELNGKIYFYSRYPDYPWNLKD